MAYLCVSLQVDHIPRVRIDLRVGEVHGGVAPHQRAFEHTNKFYGLASFIVFAHNLWLWQRNIPQNYTCYPCSDDSLRTDASLGSKQHSTPKGSDQRRDDQLTTTPKNRPDQYQDCVGPWPGYPECAEKMEVQRSDGDTILCNDG